MLNNIKNFKSFSIPHDLVIKTIYQLCMGMLGAVIILLFLHLWGPKENPRIATINITGLVDNFIKTEVKTKKDLPPDEVKKLVQTFGATLEKTMQGLSSKYHLVLMPAEAVIAGAPDYTVIVQKHLDAINLTTKPHDQLETSIDFNAQK